MNEQAHAAGRDLVPVDIDSRSIERLAPPVVVAHDAAEMPPLLRDLSARIAAVMRAVRPLAYDAYNTHAEYDYASADKFYDALRLPLAEAELAVRCDEVDCRLFTVPNRDGRAVLHARFVYELGFVGYPGAERRSIVMQLLGPQSFQAAETYARKYWLCGKFLVATGETDDVDAEPRYGETVPVPDAGATANGDRNGSPALPAAADLAANLPAQFETERDRHRHLYRLFGNAMRETADPQSVIDGNAELWAEIPAVGRNQLLSHFRLERPGTEED